MIATSVAYDLVFLVHIIAAVSTLIVLIVMRWSAQLVVRGADSATQIARFPERRNWAARVMLPRVFFSASTIISCSSAARAESRELETGLSI